MATPAARGTTRGGALVYGLAADVAKWAEGAKYALRYGLQGSGRWQRIAIVHGATIAAATSDANYFVVYAIEVGANPVKQDTDTF